MFSSKVIIAIEVLSMLRLSEYDVRERKKQTGTDLSEVLEAGKIHRTTYRLVLRTLMQKGYIVFTGDRNCYAALHDPSQITLLQLVQLFHGDICIGESYNHRLVFGPEKSGSGVCRSLLAYEKRLYDALYETFRKTPITAFRTSVPQPQPKAEAEVEAEVEVEAVAEE